MRDGESEGGCGSAFFSFFLLRQGRGAGIYVTLRRVAQTRSERPSCDPTAENILNDVSVVSPWRIPRKLCVELSTSTWFCV